MYSYTNGFRVSVRADGGGSRKAIVGAGRMGCCGGGGRGVKTLIVEDAAVWAGRRADDGRLRFRAAARRA